MIRHYRIYIFAWHNSVNGAVPEKRFGPLRVHDEISRLSDEVFDPVRYAKITLSGELITMEKIRAEMMYLKLLSTSRELAGKDMCAFIEISTGGCEARLVMYDDIVIAAQTRSPSELFGDEAIQTVSDSISGFIDIAIYSFDRNLLPEFKTPTPPITKVEEESEKATYDLVGIYDVVYLAARRHVVRVLDVEVNRRSEDVDIRVFVKPTGGLLFGWKRAKKKFIKMIDNEVRSKYGVTPKIDIVEVAG